MIRFHPQASAEAVFSLDYYESKEMGLGARFLQDLSETLDRVQAHPNAWPEIPTKNQIFRRCLFKRFPYALVYKTQKNLIGVMAVMHLSRKPGYWSKRKLNP
jgi:hypothetical protein